MNTKMRGTFSYKKHTYFKNVECTLHLYTRVYIKKKLIADYILRNPSLSLEEMIDDKDRNNPIMSPYQNISIKDRLEKDLRLLFLVYYKAYTVCIYFIL